ncbi:hypothetical protein BGZ60DRAFT_47922 [Tricladium varicosporioides]|nr:hypothetical protein BGZ60DRAFT_47922 [Hymenoscyphus varicosporioides]
MITTPYFRTACEECHSRKVRCKPSTEESRGSTRCEACRINGRKCLFSLRSKTGRPRNSTTLAYNSIYKPSVPAASSSIVEFPASYPTSGSMKFPEPKNKEHPGLHPWPSLIDEQQNHPSLNFNSIQDQNCSPSQEKLNTPMNEYEGRSDEAWRSPTLPSPTQASFQTRDTTDLSAYLSEDVLSIMFSTKEQNQSVGFSNLKFLENTAQPTAQISTPQAPRNTFPNSSSQFRVSTAASKIDPRKPETVSDIVQTIGICNELRKYGQAVPRKKISLFSSGDDAEIHQMLNSVDKLCTKISNSIPQQLPSTPLRDQPTFILVFTAVMQAIEQTVERLGGIAEFEHACETGDPSMNSGDINMDLGGMQTEKLVLNGSGNTENAPSPYMYGQHRSVLLREYDASEAEFPQLQLEQVLSLTRLDFYLLQMKSFIAHFDTSLELLAATEYIFNPAQSSARLLAYHRCLDRVLGYWKNKWWK